MNNHICVRCGKFTEDFIGDGMLAVWMCKDCQEEYKVEIAEQTEQNRAKAIEIMIKEIIPQKFRAIETDITAYKGKSLFICGKSGVGKTVLACCLLKYQIRQEHRCKFINYPDFINRLRNMYFKNNPEESPYDYAESIAQFDGWLCLDDIGVENQTDYTKQITYYIINSREINELPVIITSNFRLSDLADKIDSRIASRISGICEKLEMTGKDMRL
jgi:DNA replication protein DnaC